MIQRRLIQTSTWALCACFIAGLALPDDSHAARRRNGGARSGKIQFDRGSAESTPERERRLLRECKGRNNAGACEGFTR
jgi:hypothetical protein